MPTLEAMVSEAVGLGYGEATQLRATFLNWQKRGLLGRAERKANRRGGEGIWHAAQRRLWLSYLRQRAAGVRVTTLVNMPVGLWLMGEQGIELDQAQRAFSFWAESIALTERHNGARPSGTRSLRRRGLEANVSLIATPATSRTARRRLVAVLERLLDATPEFRLEVADFESVVRDVIDPLGRGGADQRADAIYTQLSLQFLALANLNELVASNKRGWDWWNWARESLGTFLDRERRSGLDEDAGFDLRGYLNGACSTLVLMFGIGLDARHRGVLGGPMTPPPGYGLEKGGRTRRSLGAS